MFQSTGHRKLSQKLHRRLRKRSQLQMEMLERRELLATITWNGNSDTQWGNANNWTPAQVPGAADTAVFTSTANNTTVDLGGARNSQISFTNDNTKTFNLINGSIVTNSIAQTGGGSNTIASQIAAGATTAITVSGGTLSLGNATNVLDNADSVTVSNNARLNFAVGTGGARAIGTSVVNLNNGTLGMIAGAGGFTPGLLEGYIGANFDTTTPNPGTGGPFGPGTGGQKLSAVAGNHQADQAPYWNGDNITWVYTGQFFDADGVVSFAANIDDSTLVRIDGVNRINDGNWQTADTTGVLNLGMGANGDGWHDIEIRFAEGGGGAGPSGQNINGGSNWVNTKGFGWNPDGTTSLDANAYQIPVDPGNGTLFRGQPVATAGTNTINVSGNSTINTGAFPTVSFGALNLASNAQLTVTTPGTVTFTGAANLAGGNTISNTGTVVLSGVVSGAALTKTGTGTLALSNAGNNYTGTTTVNAGTLRVDANGALGTTAGGATVNAGGTLAIRTNYTSLEPVTLNRGTLESTGNNSFAGNITSSAGSIVSSSGTFTLSGTVNVAQGVFVNGAGTTNVTGQVTDGGLGATVAGGLAGNYYSGQASTESVLDRSPTNPNLLTVQQLMPTVPGYFTPRVDFGGGTETTAGDGNTLDRGGSGGNVFGGIGIVGFLPNDQYQAVWTGFIDIPVADNYTFTTRSDDGTRLWIDINNDGDFLDAGEQAVDNNFFQGMTNRSSSAIALTPGLHAIRIAGYEGGGDAGFQASWQSSSFGRRIIEPAALRAATGDLTMIAKLGSGTLILSNANNNYGGGTYVQAGTLRADTSAALGTATGGTLVNNNATLQLNGAVNIADSVMLTGQGVGNSGALSHSGAGTATLSGNITAAGSNAAIGSAAGKLVLAGQISLPSFSELTFTGAGDIDVVQAFGNAATTVPNALLQQWFYTGGIPRDEAFSNNIGNNNNGGMLNYLIPRGTNYRTGPLSLNGLAEFNAAATTTPNATTLGPTFGWNNVQEDDFAFLWTGFFTAPVTGTYTFSVGPGPNAVDDEAIVLLDRNDDGVFSNASERLASTLDMGCCGVGRSYSVNLTAGETHRFVTNFHEFGGGQVTSTTFRIAGHATFGSDTAIQPNSPAQAGMWSAVSAYNSVFKTGTGTVTFMGANTYNGGTTVTAGTLVAANSSALGAGSRTTVESGAALALQGGITVNEPLTINGTGPTGAGAIVNISGNNTVSGAITAKDSSSGTIGFGSTAGTLTLGGNIDPRFSSVAVSGAGDVVLTGNVLPAAANINRSGGLHGNYYSGVGSTEAMLNPSPNDPNRINLEYQSPAVFDLLTPRVDFGVGTDGAPGDGNTLDRDGLDGNVFGGIGVNIGNDNVQGLWTGQIYIPETADYTFTTRSDDGTKLWIDINNDGDFTDAGEEVVNNNFFQGMTNRSGTVTLTVGAHAIRIAGYEGGGGAGFQASWQQLNGTAPFGRRIIEPGVLGDFYFADNRLVKSGTGTLTINGTAAFVGGTTITGGTLNGTGTLSSAVVVNGALGGGGTGSVGALTITPAATAAAVVSTASSVGSFPVLANDLLTGRPAVRTGSNLNGDEGTSNNPAVLVNGTFGPAQLPDAAALAQTVSISNNTQLTYELDVAANPQGYDISEIDVYSGWRDSGRDDINVTIRYATVDNPGTFVTLGTINHAPNPANSGRGTLSSSLLASRVRFVQFDFGGQENGFVGYRELDVIGGPSASLTVGATGSFLAEIGTASADSVNVNGSVNIAAGATLNLQFIGATTPNVGSAFTLINNDGTDPIVGTFAGIADDAIVTINGHAVRVDYNGGTGNDLVITLVPTPPSVTFNPVATPSGSEDNPALPNSATRIPLGVVVSNLDSGATTTLVISGIPQSTGPNAHNGARLYYNGVLQNAVNGTVTIPNVANGPVDLAIEKDDNRPLGTYPLTISATSVTPVGDSTASTTTRNVTVTNSAPEATIDGSPTVGRGQEAFFTFVGVDAPGDLATGLRYEINWGDGATTILANSNTIDPGNVLENEYTVSHTYGVLGTRTITFRAIDDEGAISNLAELEIRISAVFIDEATGTLIVGGTNNADRIILTNTAGGVQARINNQLFPALAPENGLIQVYGGGGNDTISLSSNVPFPVEVFGGAGNDYITGGGFGDVLHGEAGNDRLLGGGGRDLLFGGDGSDQLSGGTGNDLLYGDSDATGDLTLPIDEAIEDYLFNLTPSDNPGVDKMNGDAGDDTVDGGAGKDRLNGGVGNDFLYGGDDSDYLSGDSGEDLLMGEDGSDSMYGQAGNDVLIGGLLSDTLYGNAGSDLLLGDDLDTLTAADLYAAWVATGTGDLDEMRTYTSGVTEDGVADVMNGQLGDDWFVAFLTDRVRDASQFQGDHVDRDGVPVF